MGFNLGAFAGGAAQGYQNQEKINEQQKAGDRADQELAIQKQNAANQQTQFGWLSEAHDRDQQRLAELQSNVQWFNTQLQARANGQQTSSTPIADGASPNPTGQNGGVAGGANANGSAPGSSTALANPPPAQPQGVIPGGTPQPAPQGQPAQALPAPAQALPTPTAQAQAAPQGQSALPVPSAQSASTAPVAAMSSAAPAPTAAPNSPQQSQGPSAPGGQALPSQTPAGQAAGQALGSVNPNDKPVNPYDPANADLYLSWRMKNMQTDAKYGKIDPENMKYYDAMLKDKIGQDGQKAFASFIFNGDTSGMKAWAQKNGYNADSLQITQDPKQGPVVSVTGSNGKPVQFQLGVLADVMGATGVASSLERQQTLEQQGRVADAQIEDAHARIGMSGAAAAASQAQQEFYRTAQGNQAFGALADRANTLIGQASTIDDPTAPGSGKKMVDNDAHSYMTNVVMDQVAKSAGTGALPDRSAALAIPTLVAQAQQQVSQFTQQASSYATAAFTNPNAVIPGTQSQQNPQGMTGAQLRATFGAKNVQDLTIKMRNQAMQNDLQKRQGATTNTPQQ
jgi:hypothetical protein